MATVTVSGNLYCSDGTIIPLQTDIVEGTETTLQTNGDYTVASQDIGNYAPGKTVTHGYVLGVNNMSYAYILRQGSIVGLISIGLKGVMNKAPLPLPVPVTLSPGDICRALPSTAASRLCAVYAITGSSQRIFTVTPSGGATNEPIDLQTSNNLGDTLNNQTITQMMTVSVDGSKIKGGGVLALNEVGQVIGCNATANPAHVQPRFSMVNIPVALNYTWTLVTAS
jgi:uncharacterized membrane protein